jgi:hypothetical protein
MNKKGIIALFETIVAGLEIRNLQAAGQQEERHYRDLQFSSRHSHAHCCSLQWCSYPDLGN